MTAEISFPHYHALLAAGLTDEQARLYGLLIHQGPLQAGRLAKRSALSRPHVYKVLEELGVMGFVTKTVPPDKPALFVPTHPFAVQELLRRRQEELRIASKTIEDVMGMLASDYAASAHLPGIRLLSGLGGLATLYRDILQEGKDIRLMRSTLDKQEPERVELVNEQVALQAAKNIRTRVIAPYLGATGRLTLEEVLRQDQAQGVTRRVLPKELFNLPAQVMLYGNKVALTAYEEPLITTIIDNGAIHATFSTLFELVWGMAKEPRAMNQSPE